MSASPPPVDTSRLLTRINSEYDYNNVDAVVDTLSTIITCHIVQDVSSAMLVFNNQCYDSHSFHQYARNRTKRRDQQLISGYSRDMIQLKDPQTGEEFPFDFALSNMVYRGISLIDLKDLLIYRILGLTLEESSLYVQTNY